MSNFRISIAPKLSKQSKNGELPLYMRVTLNKQRTEISLATWINKNNWDSTYKRAKGLGGSIAGKISYLSSMDEIYDVHILTDKIRPNILNTYTSDYKAGLMTPEATFWAKAKE